MHGRARFRVRFGQLKVASTQTPAKTQLTENKTIKLVHIHHLRLSEIPVAMRNVDGLNSGPPARFEA